MNTTERENQTRVVFRFWKNSAIQGVIALFPDIGADHRGNVESYEHVGQHGAADYSGVIAMTRPATEAEYAPLLRELKQIGYALRIVRKR